MINKRMLYLFLISFLIYVVVYSINSYLALGIDTYFINLLPKDELPKEYQEYKKLSEIEKFGAHTITTFHVCDTFYATSTYEILEISKDNIVLKIKKQIDKFDHGGGNSGDIYLNQLFKFDPFGNVLDTFEYKTSSSNQSEFGDIILINKQIVNRDLLYYLTWPTDADTTKKEFTPINKELLWDDEKMDNYYEQHIAPNSIYVASFYAWRDKQIRTEKRQSLIYFADNEWFVVYGVTKNTNEKVRKLTSNNQKEIKNKNMFGDIPADKVTFNYFHKLEYCSNMMGRTQSNDVYTYYYWNGIGYLSVVFENDILKLQQESAWLDDYDTQENSKNNAESNQTKMKEASIKKYGYYSNANLKFALISDDENHNLYLVKKTE